MCKYSKWYNIIISKAAERGQPDGYFEKHHIVPKSLGGTNEDSNIARLTAREHFMCHLLLVKMHTGESRFKMLCAIQRFAFKGKYKSRMYAAYKAELMIERSIRMSGENNPNYGGKCQTADVKQKMRKPKADSSKMGRWDRTPEAIERFKENRVGKGTGERNAMASSENRAKVAASKLGKKKYIKDGVGKMFQPGTEPEGWLAARK